MQQQQQDVSASGEQYLELLASFIDRKGPAVMSGSLALPRWPEACRAEAAPGVPDLHDIPREDCSCIIDQGSSDMTDGYRCVPHAHVSTPAVPNS